MSRASDTKPNGPRAAALATTVLLHLAMLAALIALQPELIIREREPAMVVGSLPLAAESEAAAAAKASAPNPVPVPPPMPLQMPIVEPPPPIEVVDPEALTPQFDAEPDPALTGDAVGIASASNAGAAGTACPVVASLQAALEQDGRALSALALVPRTSRSVANAVMLWDGRWIAPERAGGAAVADAIRGAVARVLAGTSDDCRTQANLGPVFVPVVLMSVRGEAGTMVLAIGSGTWRWADLLRDASASVAE